MVEEEVADVAKYNLQTIKVTTFSDVQEGRKTRNFQMPA